MHTIFEFDKNSNYKLAKGVGHTWFECDNNSNIVALFDEIIGFAKITIEIIYPIVSETVLAADEERILQYESNLIKKRF